MRIIAGVLVLAAMHAAAQTKPIVKRYTLSGTIVDGVSKRPLAGVEVTLQTEKWEAVGDAATSDATGRFGFGELAAGRYILSATNSTFGTVHYGEATDPGWVSTVQIGMDGRDKSLLFPVLPRSGITGVVRDEYNDPIMRATVNLLVPVWREGRTILTSVAGKTTDDRGRYRFGRLAPGNYILCTTGTTNGSTPAPVPGSVDFAARPENRFYVRTCYPGVNRTLQLAPGQDAQLDLTPLTAPAVTVRGHVTNAPKTGFAIQLIAEDASEGAEQLFSPYQFNGEQGTFAMRGVPPGKYRLVASVSLGGPEGAGKKLMAELPVSVGSADVDGLELAMEAGGTVDVTYRGLAENRIDASTVNAGLRRADGRDSHSESRDRDGTLHFLEMPPGRYWLTTRTPDDVCVESVKAGDRDIRDTPVRIAAGSAVRIELTMSRKCGAIHMRAVRGEEAVPGAKVVLLLSGTAKEPGDMLEDFADDEGEMSFAGLRPGRYLMWAWAVTGKDAFGGPASLAAVAQQAISLEVGPGEPVKVDVPLLQDGGKAK